MKKKKLSFEDFGVPDFSALSTAEINNGVVTMVETLNLGSGSTHTVELYRLMQMYLKDIEARNRINDVLHSLPGEGHGQVDIIKNRQSFSFYARLLKNFVTEFETMFLPEMVEEENCNRNRDDLMKCLDRLFHIYSMMINDL